MENRNVCCDCGDIIDDDETRMHDNDIYCESCFHENFTMCDGCNEPYDSDDIITIHDCNYCPDCYNDRYTECGSCGEIISIHNTCTNDNGDTYCESCFDEADVNTIIHDHNYTPCIEFYGDDRKELHLGLEYEVYNNTNSYNNTTVAECINDAFSDFFYLKEDSSINNGFEIVSHPSTLHYHQKEVDYEKLTSLLKSKGFSSDSKNGNCGIHVHIERNWIEYNCGKLAAVKYGLFIHNIQKFAEILARRAGSHWADFSRIEQDYYKILAKSIKPYHADKYSAINYQHTDTIETRIFAGTIRSYRLLAAMEFCHAAINHVNNIGYTHICQKHDYTLWSEFTEYVKKNTRLYTNLLKNMNEFNMIGS
jgi:hypothetical protein